MDKQDVQNLKKRYLLWLYKVTKEAFDKYERKFTQLEVDEALLKEIERTLKDSFLPGEKSDLEHFVNGFRKYIDDKEEACMKLKYKEKKTNPEFIFLDVKLNAVETLIKKEFGKKFLEAVKTLYEEEMVQRIMERREEKG
jgi:hypothetical protein